jgi:hypothetical protein
VTRYAYVERRVIQWPSLGDTAETDPTGGCDRSNRCGLFSRVFVLLFSRVGFGGCCGNKLCFKKLK